MKAAVFGIVIVIATALVVGFLPLMEVPYTKTIQYQDTETYYVDEPYEVIEPYTETVPLNYEVVKSYVANEKYTEPYLVRTCWGGVQEKTRVVRIQVASVEVRNTDDTAGSFNVSFSGFTPSNPAPPTVQLDLSPGEIKTARCPSEYVYKWRYNVTPGTKEVEKERTVTEYREVQKERTVTRERTETHYKEVTIFEYLLSRFQS